MDQILNVLLVEDSEEDAELVALALKRGGYQIAVRRVETRPALIEALEDACDVIIADYSLPQFSLFEALAIVKEEGLDVPFLIVSASIVEDMAIRAMRQGA